MMEERQRQTLAEVKNPRYISANLVKACIKVVNCNAKLGDINQARQAVAVTGELGSVPGIPALCQAMISGVKAQLDSIAELEAAWVSGDLKPPSSSLRIFCGGSGPTLEIPDTIRAKPSLV